MAFFRRDRDSVEEFRRGRQSLSRPTNQSFDDETFGSDDQTSLYQVDEVETPANGDPLEKYRQGAAMVAKDSAFSGTLKSNSNLCIEGNFDGELEAKETVFVAQGAHVKADIHASDVIVAGSLDGTVTASGRFHAMPSAQVSGQIKSAILVVDQGSHVNCRFAMQAKKEASR